MKILNKLLIGAFSTMILANLVNAQTTVCYKNNWNTPSTIESTPLEGDVCEGKYSLNDMKKDGWNVLDIKIDSNQNKLSYRYFLVKGAISNNEIDTQTSNKSSNFTIRPLGVKIENIQDNKSTINIGNLVVGSSGIVVHVYDNDKRLIVSNAKVIESNENNSVVEFFDFNDLKQDAIPTSNRKVQINDILVLNYMYQSSLVIAPTQDTFKIVRSNFKYNNFLHSDLFAAQLKFDSQPFPSKKDIQNFAIKQNIGTIFIVADKKVHVLDSKTFEKLADFTIPYKNEDFSMPFYSRVEKIDTDLFTLNFSIPFIGESKPKTYEAYYKKILGLN
jgi:hypothetical protein